jgi:hypothetical protein
MHSMSHEYSPHRGQLYLPRYPHDEQSFRAGVRGGGDTASRYGGRGSDGWRVSTVCSSFSNASQLSSERIIRSQRGGESIWGVDVARTSSSSQSFRLFLAYNIFLTFPLCFFLAGWAVPPRVGIPIEFAVGADALGWGTKEEAGISVGLVRSISSKRRWVRRARNSNRASAARSRCIPVDVDILELLSA